MNFVLHVTTVLKNKRWRDDETSFRNNDSDSTLQTSVMLLHFYGFTVQICSLRYTRQPQKSYVGNALMTWVVNYTCLWTLGVVTNRCSYLHVMRLVLRVAKTLITFR